MKRLWALLCTFVVIGMPGVVCAHAVIEQAFPFSGAVLDVSPQFVRLTFNEKVAGKTSVLVIRDVLGNEVAGTREDIDDYTIQMGLPPLAPGTYSVLWQVLSADTHVAEGQYVFSVQTQLTHDVPAEPINIAPPEPQQQVPQQQVPQQQVPQQQVPQQQVPQQQVPQQQAPQQQAPQQRAPQQGVLQQEQLQTPNASAQQRKNSSPQTDVKQPHRSHNGTDPLETNLQEEQRERFATRPNTPKAAPAHPNGDDASSGHAHHSVDATPRAVFASVYDVVRAILRGSNNVAWIVLIVCMVAPYVWQNIVRVRPAVVIGASIVIAATVWGQLAVIADAFSDRVSWSAAWQSIVVGDRFGLFAFVQTIVLAFGVSLLYAPVQDRRWAHNVHMAAVVLALIVASLQTHIGTLFATEWRAIVRVVHVWAMSCWIGSVVFAAVAFVQHKGITQKHRRWAVISGVVAIGSGIALAGMLLPSWGALFASTYGTLLLGKSALALLMAGVGLALRGKRSVPAVAVEQLLCIGIVVCASVMGMTPPSM
jgi:methionine-rich copper-binding protein CopC/putative copper export protein